MRSFSMSVVPSRAATSRGRESQSITLRRSAKALSAVGAMSSVGLRRPWMGQRFVACDRGDSQASLQQREAAAGDTALVDRTRLLDVVTEAVARPTITTRLRSGIARQRSWP